jgi:hypothetical protein
MLIRTIATLSAGTLATGAAIAGTAFATPTSPTTPDPELTVPCGAVWQRLPQGLRDDLSALEEMTPRERRVALREIGRDARQGEYGDRVQRVAKRIAERRAELSPVERRQLRDELAERRATCAEEGADPAS